jgi:hypothetical protein
MERRSLDYTQRGSWVRRAIGSCRRGRSRWEDRGRRRSVREDRGEGR